MEALQGECPIGEKYFSLMKRAASCCCHVEYLADLGKKVHMVHLNF
jgi:hypothetical protein